MPKSQTPRMPRPPRHHTHSTLYLEHVATARGSVRMEKCACGAARIEGMRQWYPGVQEAKTAYTASLRSRACKPISIYELRDLADDVGLPQSSLELLLRLRETDEDVFELLWAVVANAFNLPASHNIQFEDEEGDSDV